MGMSKEQFSEQYRQFFPEATDEEIDKIYVEAKNLVSSGAERIKAKVTGSPFRNSGDEPRKEFSKDDLAAVDWQTIGEVILTSNVQRYINYWILKKSASKVLGRKVTFKEVYFASMALRAVARTLVEVGVSRVSIESDQVAKIKKALEPITKR